MKQFVHVSKSAFAELRRRSAAAQQAGSAVAELVSHGKGTWLVHANLAQREALRGTSHAAAAQKVGHGMMAIPVALC